MVNGIKETNGNDYVGLQFDSRRFLTYLETDLPTNYGEYHNVLIIIEVELCIG